MTFLRMAELTFGIGSASICVSSPKSDIIWETIFDCLITSTSTSINFWKIFKILFSKTHQCSVDPARSASLFPAFFFALFFLLWIKHEKLKVVVLVAVYIVQELMMSQHNSSYSRWMGRSNAICASKMSHESARIKPNLDLSNVEQKRPCHHRALF